MHPELGGRLAAVAAVTWLGACAVAPRPGSRKVFAQHRDSVTAHCPHNPEVCAATAKGVTDGIPAAVGAAGLGLAATQAAHAATVVRTGALDPATQKAVDQALKECADQARSEVLVPLFPRGGPTQEDCDEILPTRGPRGEPITRAMELGQKMHRAAFNCVEERLGKLIPGRFSIEQQYRFDPTTKKTTVVSAAEANELLRQWRGAELRGTIVPDVVIHTGSPRFPQAVYDFKFPCLNTDMRPDWRRYPDGRNQGQLYQDALGQPPAQVVPRLGVLR